MAEYDVCLSFAGEDRVYVESVARELRERGIRVFYDKYEQATLWGKNLYQHLSDVYSNHGRFCVIFISEAYARKLWTRHELETVQARAFRESSEYLLPARFDDTRLPGLPETTGYVDLRTTTPNELAEMISVKAGSNALSAERREPPIELKTDERSSLPATGVQQTHHVHSSPQGETKGVTNKARRIRQLVRETFRELAERMDDVYVTPNIPSRMERNARERFLRSADRVVAFVSSSYAGEDGLAILTSGIAWRNSHREGRTRLTWKELSQFAIKGSLDDNLITIGKDLEIDLVGSDALARPIAQTLRRIVAAQADERSGG